MDISKFLTKETLTIAFVVIYMLVQSNYFATKLDIANLKIEMQQYSDNNDKELQEKLSEQYTEIIDKIDRLKNDKR